LTLAALAQALGCKLRKDESVIASIKAKFKKVGREMKPNNERQAMVPEIGEVIENPVGTAPMFCCAMNQATVYLLPGVPRELKWLFKENITPRIDQGSRSIFRRTLKIVGRGESRLEHSIQSIIDEHEKNVQFGFRAVGVENHIKLMASGADAENAIQLAEHDLRAHLGTLIYGSDQEVLPEVVGRALKARQETLSLAESCTGGLIAKLLTDVPGSSAYLIGACVAYANSAKCELLGVDPKLIDAEGAVSMAVAKAMAEGAKNRMGSSWAIATTGIAGPDGGHPDKPVGTVFIALAGPDETTVERKHMLGNRSGVRENTALSCLEILRRKLM